MQAGKRDQMKAYQAKWKEAATLKGQLENAVGNGQLSMEDYKGIL